MLVWPVQANQIGVALTLNYQLVVPVLDKDHCRPRVAVVIGGHRVAISPGVQHCQDVARLGSRQPLVLTQNVTGLAILAGQANVFLDWSLGIVGQDRFIFSLVEGWPDVVAHPPSTVTYGFSPGTSLREPTV